MTVLRITPEPTPQEAAAVVAVLALLRRPAPPLPQEPPRWARGARLEGLGQAPLSDASDPRLREGLREGVSRR